MEEKEIGEIHKRGNITIVVNGWNRHALVVGGGGCAIPVNAGLTETYLKILRIWKQCL